MSTKKPVKKVTKNKTKKITMDDFVNKITGLENQLRVIDIILERNLPNLLSKICNLEDVLSKIRPPKFSNFEYSPEDIERHVTNHVIALQRQLLHDFSLQLTEIVKKGFKPVIENMKLKVEVTK